MFELTIFTLLFNLYYVRIDYCESYSALHAHTLSLALSISTTSFLFLFHQTLLRICCLALLLF
jgi:hypothetical protein